MGGGWGEGVCPRVGRLGNGVESRGWGCGFNRVLRFGGLGVVSELGLHNAEFVITLTP